MNSKAGNLYIVATPIGNLGDITYRAVEVLKQVDRLLAEDTRHSRTLLDYYAIRTPLTAFHEHNETHLIPAMLDTLVAGESIALISDAGTPLVSDPGYKLVNQAQAIGIQAQTLPGPCAAIAALAVAGLPTDRFAFEGFLPAKSGQRAAVLETLHEENKTLVFYEAKHRIIASLSAMSTAFGANREVVVARELTKKFETVIRGSFQQLIATLSNSPEQQKGEFVVVVAGQQRNIDDVGLDSMLTVLLQELSIKQASRLASKLSGVGKNRCYEAAIKLKDENE